MKTTLTIGLLTLGLLTGVGCRSNRPAERFGKTFYVDGAGNWSHGSFSVARGLREAGYQGDVEVFWWSTSLNPLIDELNVPAAKLRAASLARRIEEYRRKHPDTRINVIGLSAGAGVATWAVEQLHSDAAIHNLVLLSSSLSNDYDVSRALSNMTGGVFVYHSPRDRVLKSVRVIGTIDGKRFVNPAGLVGLTKPAGLENRIVNVAWSPAWVPYGWTGSHTGSVSAKFVKHEISRHIVPDQDALALLVSARGDERSATR